MPVSIGEVQVETRPPEPPRGAWGAPLPDDRLPEVAVSEDDVARLHRQLHERAARLHAC
jgi:hypothetical protein